MDRRYKENKGASSRPVKQQEALARARLARARVSMRSVTADDSSRPNGGQGERNLALAIRNQARGAERQERQQVFNEEGSGSYGGGISFADARRGAKIGEGRAGLI